MKIALIVGNGLTIDLIQQNNIQLDTQNPFALDFEVPEGSGRHWKDAFPRITEKYITRKKNFKYLNKYRDSDFEFFRYLVEDDYSVEIEAEARHFLAFAYSFFQQRINHSYFNNWKWKKWIKEYSMSVSCIFSFNYDLIIEEVFSKIGSSLIPHGIDGTSSDIFFAKPHGSINFESNKSVVKLPPTAYPLKQFVTRNNNAIVKLNKDELLQARQESYIVLPNEYSPYKEFPWVGPAYQMFNYLAYSLTHAIFIGLSYWKEDREEINFLINSLPAKTKVIEVNPDPNNEFKEYVKQTDKLYEHWRKSPQKL